MIKPAYSSQKIKKLLPLGYESRLSPQEKLDITYSLATKVEEKYGLKVVAASVMGSSLRGVDRPDSDTDFLLLTDQKMKSAMEVDVDGEDAYVQNVFTFAQKMNRSVPYVEFVQSPFLLANDNYRAYVTSQRAHRASLMRHGLSFIETLVTRKANRPTKALVNTMCTVNLLFNNSSLMNRNEINTNSELAQFTKQLLTNEELYSQELNDLFENNVNLL